MIDLDSSETNLFIVTKRDRFRLFYKLYWRSFIIFAVPLILMPIAFIVIGNENKKAYKCFYVFVITAVYWITDAMHPSIIAMVPVALSLIMGATGDSFISEMYLRNDYLDCAGVMIIIIAIEQSQLNRRMALYLLLIFGCSHYRLSFLMFFITMSLSMWFSCILICGLMMPLMKAILTELEKMGILEIYETVGKVKQTFYFHGESQLRPTCFTTFYFLGIAYSSSIGAMATLVSSQTNQMFKIYCEKIFPTAPIIEFPYLMLLNLPGVILMEAMLYFWMNFYFVGMFRSSVHLEISMTEEESQYVKTLLDAQLRLMGKVTLNEWIVIFVVLLAALLQATVSVVYIESADFINFHNHQRISSPCLFSVLLLFILPKNQDFLEFFKKRADRSRPLAQTPCKKCLSWAEVRDNMHWGVLIIIACSSALFESLQSSQMTSEFEKFLLYFKGWSPVSLILVVVVFCKLLSEFAPGPSVAYALLPHIARVSILSKVNPQYLMLGATYSISLSFHLVAGTPVNAMVAAYMHIPPFKMLWGGVVPTLCSLAVAWFTAAAWCVAILPDGAASTQWAGDNSFQIIA